MRQHPRIRKIVKWGGTVISVLLLMIWIASGWWANMVIVSPGPILIISAGQLDVQWFKEWSVIPDAFWWGPVVRLSDPFQWWFEFGRIRSPTGSIIGWAVIIPIWFLVLLTGAPTFWMWRQDRRRTRIGTCPKCGYSLTGLPAGHTCPECGTPAPPDGGPS